MSRRTAAPRPRRVSTRGSPGLLHVLEHCGSVRSEVGDGLNVCCEIEGDLGHARHPYVRPYHWWYGSSMLLVVADCSGALVQHSLNVW